MSTALALLLCGFGLGLFSALAFMLRDSAKKRRADERHQRQAESFARMAIDLSTHYAVTREQAEQALLKAMQPWPRR